MKLTLTEIRNEARGTKSFFWQPEKTVSFYPGQYYYFTLPALKYTDPKGTTRHFTISSSPTEGEILRLTTRIREESGYKKTLAQLQIGSEIEGEGPNGTFIFSESEAGPHIFIAGGIGITPFRSIIKYIADKNLLTPIYLIYSNSDNDFVFKKELGEIAVSHPNIKIQYVVTSVEGHLDELKIGKMIENWPPAHEGLRPGGKLSLESLTWWACGPPPMINAIEKSLGKLKITSGQVRSEKFTGY